MNELEKIRKWFWNMPRYYPVIYLYGQLNRPISRYFHHLSYYPENAKICVLISVSTVWDFMTCALRLAGKLSVRSWWDL